MNRHTRIRGLTYIELLCAMAIGSMVLMIVMSIAITGTRTFAREQGQAFTQFRVRTALDAIAMDIRLADAVVANPTLPANDGAFTLEVPCQSPNAGIVYNGTTMYKDTITYWHSSDGVLHRTTSVGNSASKRKGATNPYTVTVAQGVTAFAYKMWTKDGSQATAVSDAAIVDISCKVASTLDSQPFTLALTSVRMRNKRLPSS
ncbi:MAG TPA: hypothetical protein VGM37_05140 [Armatimonadota bacterium]|jgi:type II secretory pathway pseudopilin PulG